MGSTHLIPVRTRPTIVAAAPSQGGSFGSSRERATQQYTQNQRPRAATPEEIAEIFSQDENPRLDVYL